LADLKGSKKREKGKVVPHTVFKEEGEEEVGRRGAGGHKRGAKRGGRKG